MDSRHDTAAGGPGRLVCVSVVGDLDLATAQSAEQQLHSALSAGCARVVLDLSRCGFVDLAGHHVLERARRAARAVDVPLVVCGQSERVRRLLALLDDLVLG